jgi:hypothetical protein
MHPVSVCCPLCACRGCMADASRCRQGPALLGRSRPQRAIDLSLWTAASTAPLFGRLLRYTSRSPCAAVALRHGRVTASRSPMPRYHFPPSCVLCRDMLRAWGTCGLSTLRRDNISTDGSSPFSARCHHAGDPLLRFVRERLPFFNSPRAWLHFLVCQPTNLTTPLSLSPMLQIGVSPFRLALSPLARASWQPSPFASNF